MSRLRRSTVRLQTTGAAYNLKSIYDEHMANIKTISGVKAANAIAGYKEMPIYTPTMLVSGGTDNDS